MDIVSDRSSIAASFQIRDLPLVETFDGCSGSKAGTGLGKKKGLCPQQVRVSSIIFD